MHAGQQHITFTDVTAAGSCAGIIPLQEHGQLTMHVPILATASQGNYCKRYYSTRLVLQVPMQQLIARLLQNFTAPTVSDACGEQLH
jgi:hypothetical protein